MMRTTLMTIALTLLLATPASAQQTPPTPAQEAAAKEQVVASLTQSFGAIAAKFGCTQMVNNDLNSLQTGPTAQLVTSNISFALPGETDAQWTRKFSAAVNFLPMDAAMGNQVLATITQTYLDQLKAVATVNDMRMAKDQFGGPVTYVDYTLTKDNTQAVGVIARNAPMIMSFSEIKANGKALDADSITAMKQFTAAVARSGQ